MLERWTSSLGLRGNFIASVTDWEHLKSLVRLQSGTHTLKLVVDSTNLIPESNEIDNAFQWEFRWQPSALGSASPTPVPTKLPDLAPFTPEGWGGPLIATSYSGDTVDGPLSVNVPSYIRYSMRNQGLSSTPETIWVHLYLDDVLVDRRVFDGLLAEGIRARSEWDGLFETTNVTPGPHSLKVVVDATGLVSESNEQNNTFEKQLTWGTGPVPPKAVAAPVPAPTPPAPLTLPNLVPGWVFGWDGPIVVSNDRGAFLDTPLTVDKVPFIDIVLHNESAVGVAASFAVDLYFDGEMVHTYDFPGQTDADIFRFWEDWGQLSSRVTLTEGAHTLRIVIDPDNAVQEANEDDNVYEKTFVWSVGGVEAPTPITFTDEEIQETLSDLQLLLDTREPALAAIGADYTQQVLGIADAGYYLMTGKSLKDERVSISLLPHDDYIAWIDDSFAERFAVSEESAYAELLVRRERTKREFVGFKTRRFDRVAVVVDAQHDIADVINTLVHELGHMRQDFLNPAQTEAGPFFHLDALQEAQAQQFERAFWLALKGFTGLSLLAYPEYDDFHGLVDNRLEGWLAEVNQDEHAMGYLLQWLAVLEDPELTGLKSELASSGGLGADSSLALYDYLVGLPPDSVSAYVAARLEAIATHLETMRALSVSRLVPGLHPDGEGSPDLRVPALLTP